MVLIRFFLICIFSTLAFTQEVNIIEQLKAVESGNVQKAKEDLKELKSDYPASPEVLFLDAVLTENGKAALNKYSAHYLANPDSKFASASLYRIFSYYYSLGAYNKATEYLNELKTKFPNSPYIKAADRTIPDERFETPVHIEEKPQVNKTQTYNVKEEANFTIQAGAFLNSDNAQRLYDSFKSKGFESEITKKDVAGSILNVVTVGKFETESEVRSILQNLNSEFNIRGRIIRLNN